MSPEEKAVELVAKFQWNPQTKVEKQRAKQCAIICCDEIIEDHKNNAYLEDWKTNLIEYWQQVKTEIQKL